MASQDINYGSARLGGASGGGSNSGLKRDFVKDAGAAADEQGRSEEQKVDLINNLPHAQKERLAFIDFSLQFFGHITRNDLVERFQTGLAACTRDFAMYRDLAYDNLWLDHSSKQYLRKDSFIALFEHPSDVILTSLSRGFGNGISHYVQPSEQCFDAIQLIHPDSEIIASIMRGIHNQKVCLVNYVSVSSGESQRQFVPHAMINNGHRWHVRGYDCKHQDFRDFVCTRFTAVEVTDQTASAEQTQAADVQFHRNIDLILIPHPSISNSLAIEMDYDMHDGQKIISTKASLAAYVLRQWQVDCSHGYRFVDQGCQLALENTDVLSYIDNPTLAPGYNIAR